MNSKNSYGIKFEAEDIEKSLNRIVYVPMDNNSQLEEIVRKYFRLPTSNPDKVKVQINDQQYDIIDIANEGIGIHLPLLGIFSAGKELNSIKLTVQGRIFKLHGEIVHISPYDYGNYRCGIKFIYQDEEIERIISEYIKINRAKLFST